MYEHRCGVDIIAECNGKNASVWCNRPCWNAVYGGYPKIERGLPEYDHETLPKDVFEMVLYKTTYENNPNLQNACATRISIALINAGMTVSKKYQEYIIQKGGKMVKWKGFIVKAELLQKWLSEPAVWDTADVILDKDNADVKAGRTKGKSYFDIVREKINRRNGVYIVVGGFTSSVTGHATLWVGAMRNVIRGYNVRDIHGNNYDGHCSDNIDTGGTIYFGELK